MRPHSFENSGHLSSPRDKRDFTLKRVLELTKAIPEILPDSYFISLFNVPVLYQGKQPSCVGHATASGMMYEDDGAYSWDYSPRYLYALSKRDDGIPNQEGTYYRQAFKEAQSFGVCDNTQFPNDISLDKPIYKDASLISQNAFDVAKERKVLSYVAMNDLSWNGLKSAILNNGLVLAGVRVGNEWWTSLDDNTSWLEKDILPLRLPKQIVSGHAILLYGFDSNYIYFRNSWSADWGRKGDGYFGKDYIPYVYEAWVFKDLAPEIVANLKQQISLAQKIVELLKKLLFK